MRCSQRLLEAGQEYNVEVKVISAKGMRDAAA